MKTKAKSINYLGVTISDEGISEEAAIVSPLFISKKEIKQIKVGKRVAAERPVAALILGVFIELLCIFVILDIISRIIYGGTIYINTFLSVIFIPVGAWLIYYALKPKTLLIVHTLAGDRKICFKGDINNEELIQFLYCARAEYGYDIVTQG